MKRTKPKSTKLRTKPIHDALYAWDKAYTAHTEDITNRGRALLDLRRLKLLLTQKQAYIRLNDEFSKWLRL